MANSNGHNSYPGYGPPNGPPPPVGGPNPAAGGYPQAPHPYPGPPGPQPFPPPGPGPTRHGVSPQTLPIIVGIGVAVGVFGGLMIILGTGSDDEPELPVVQSTEVDAATTTGTTSAGAGAADVTDDKQPGQPGPTEPVVPPVTPVGIGSGGDVAVVAADAAVAEPETKTVTLRFDVTPARAVITVDGDEINGKSHKIEVVEGETKELEIAVKANGYKDKTQTVEVDSDSGRKTIDIALERVRKRPRNSGRRNNNNNNRRRNSGGLIDL